MTAQVGFAETVQGHEEEVEATDNGVTVSLTYLQRKKSPGIEMARFKADESILSMFPKSISAGEFVEQFPQVRELQIVAPYWSLNGESPIGESDRDGSLELRGMPQGFGKNFAYGLGIRRNFRGLIHEIEDKTD